MAELRGNDVATIIQQVLYLCKLLFLKKEFKVAS